MEKTYTPAQVAEHLQVPEATLTQWRYKKTGPPYFRAGKHVRYREKDLLAWERAQVAERKIA